MKIAELTNYLESLAPLALQENYDNSGLIVGSSDTEITKALITLDCTEAIVEEAIEYGCNLIIAHHPIIFGGIKKLNGKNYVERTVIKAIQYDIAIYAIHTNLDNVFNGVNQKIAQQIGLRNCKILDPKQTNLLKLITFVPIAFLEKVQSALFEAGAGHIGNYSHCSFSSIGEGTYMAGLNTNPFAGTKMEVHKESESRLEVVFPEWLKFQVVQKLLAVHPYEEVAYDLLLLQNQNLQTGSGIIGNLESGLNQNEFLKLLKEKMELEMIRFTSFKEQKIEKIAICGGSGSFLLKKAISLGVQAFVTADFKYHEFFDAENKLLIADIGHYESEKFTKTLISDLILEKFPTFALLLSKLNTNPVNYYI